MGNILNRKCMIPNKKMSFRMKIHNHFDIEVIDACTGKIKQRAEAYNVICNGLWTQLLTNFSDNYFDCIGYGDGSGTPSSADTNLFHRIGLISGSNISDREYSWSLSQGFSKTRRIGTLNAGDAVGKTLTELGVFAMTGNTSIQYYHCCTHAMIKDMNGNPISIQKTATDIIKIYADIFVHFPAGGFLNKYFQPYGNNNFLKWMTGGASIYSGRISLGSISKGIGFYSGEYLTTYGSDMSLSADASLKKITLSVRLQASDFNTSIKKMVIGFGSPNSGYSTAYLVLLQGDSWYTPDSITAEAIGTGDGETTEFKTKFPVKQFSKIYSNGIEVSDCTTRPGPENGNSLPYFVQYNNSFVDVDKTMPYLYTGSGSPQINNTAIGWNASFTSSSAFTYYFYNPYYLYGVKELHVRNSDSSATRKTNKYIDVSVDGQNWTRILNPLVDLPANKIDVAPLVVTIPSEYKNAPYWRVGDSSGGGYGLVIYKAVIDDPYPEGNIHFDTPPAEGAVITADYTPDCIAKDDQHVFDLQIEFTFGEYLGE